MCGGQHTACMWNMIASLREGSLHQPQQNPLFSRTRRIEPPHRRGGRWGRGGRRGGGRAAQGRRAGWSRRRTPSLGGGFMERGEDHGHHLD